MKLALGRRVVKSRMGPCGAISQQLRSSAFLPSWRVLADLGATANMLALQLIERGRR